MDGEEARLILDLIVLQMKVMAIGGTGKEPVGRLGRD